MFFQEAFFEPHLKTHQLDILEELIDNLDLNFNWSIIAATHFAYLGLVPTKFLAQAPIRIPNLLYPTKQIERKINFALGDTTGDAGELANYTFR